MKKWLIMVYCFLLIFIVSAQERGFRIWNQNNLDIKIDNKISVGVNEKIQYLPESGKLNQKLGELYVNRRMTPWFNMGITGRMNWFREETNWQLEYRPIVSGDLSTNFRQIEVEFSNRVEYRMFKFIDDYFRYRHRLTLETFPIKRAAWIKVYLAGEGTYRFDEEQIHLIRFHTGSKIRYSRMFEMKFYYVLEKSRKSSCWHTSDILGLNVNVDF